MSQYTGAYLLALARNPRLEMRHAAHVLAGTGKQEWPWTNEVGAQEAWCWLVTKGLIGDVIPGQSLRVEARWPREVAQGYVNLFDALTVLERDEEHDSLLGVEIRGALREAGLWHAPAPLPRQSDALAHVIELAIQKAGSAKVAVVWAQLQAMAASKEPPAPLVRLDKNDDILYRDAKGKEAAFSRKAVSDRLRRRRNRVAKAR